MKLITFSFLCGLHMFNWFHIYNNTASWACVTLFKAVVWPHADGSRFIKPKSIEAFDHLNIKLHGCIFNLTQTICNLDWIHTGSTMDWHGSGIQNYNPWCGPSMCNIFHIYNNTVESASPYVADHMTAYMVLYTYMTF